MGQAAIRITPEIIELLKKKRGGMDETLPDGRPAIDAPIIRAAAAPIQPTNNFSSPPNLTNSAAQIQSPIINKSMVDAQPIDTPVAPNVSTINPMRFSS